MDMNFSAEDIAFRDEVRAFLAANLTPELSDKVGDGEHLSKADMEAWHAKLNARGWLANHWPEAYGGPGWSAVQKYIFEHESAIAYAPRIVPFGVNMLGPVLIKYGNEQQKKHWLPRILNGDDWWCQGYSEPGAGSDLAGVKTTAVKDGDHYIVNGQKTWTTLGQHANMIFCLVRTAREGKPQEGISFLLVDMAAPGVEVRPIITLDGKHEVNEVFFSDVRVPAENLVGEENKGWTCAKYLLTYERTNIAGVGLSMAALERLQAAARQVTRRGRPLGRADRPAGSSSSRRTVRRNMATTNLRVIAAVAGGGVPGAESSMLKIRGTEIRQEISSLTRRAMGPYAQPFRPEAMHGIDAAEPVGPPEAATAAAQYFNNRKLSIFGGSNEIQKNIISKMILGL